VGSSNVVTNVTIWAAWLREKINGRSKHGGEGAGLAAICEISKTGAAKASFANLAFIPPVDTPEGARQKLVDDIEQWRLIAKLGNIEPQ
jgi:hypothetical protein